MEEIDAQKLMAAHVPENEHEGECYMKDDEESDRV